MKSMESQQKRIYNQCDLDGEHGTFTPLALTTSSASPVDTGRKLNVHKTFSLCPVSTGMRFK